MTVNPNYYCACRTDISTDAADGLVLKNTKAAVLKGAKWQPNSTITIRFLEGDATLKRRVRDVAMEWLKVANLTFDFREQGPTDIRIAFAQGLGSWSYLGTVCRQILEPEPTMNYGWLTPQSSDDVLRRVVLHEFGHAIGLIHEHQNPNGGIQWNRPAVIKDLSGPPNNWNLATIENNMFRYYPESDVHATPVDALSIMMYPIPKSWTLNEFSAGLNSELTETDKGLIKNVYPR